MLRLCLIFLLLAPILAAAQDRGILLYGLARSEASSALMARSLRTQSYRLQNLEFSTYKKKLQNWLAIRSLRLCRPVVISACILSLIP